MAKGSADNLHILSELQSSFSTGLFESLIENFPDIIHSVDSSGRIISTNRRATELLGYSKSELIGMEIFELYAVEVQQQVRLGFERLKESGFTNGVESKLRTKTGDLIEVEIRSLSLYDNDNNFDRTFSIIRDVREKKRIQAQLYQQSKLAGIGELSAGIVHDIRNPLAVILGLARNGLAKAIEKEDLSRLADIRKKVIKASQRIDRLCSHLRDYVRKEQEKATHTQLKELVEDCLLMCTNRIKNSRSVIVNEITDPSLYFIIPANSIEQVLINIISNGCDAVAQSVKREIRLRLDTSEKDALSFIVEDTGPGVPREVQEHIFESFFTTKPKGEGTGLGLSICTGILDEHGASLRLDESYTDGARFVVRVPVQKETASEVK